MSLSAMADKADEHLDPFQVSFLSGCGRSGTSLLGQILDIHPFTLFYNEPRARWVAINPDTDIWGYTDTLATSFLMERGAKLPERVRFERLFHPGPDPGQPGHVIEKTPENIFRIPWLETLHANARFVHIVRNGNDVIRSILIKAGENVPYGVSDMNNWYGKKGIKIRFLKATAMQLGLEEGVVTGCRTYTDYAALEWVCSQMAYEKAVRRSGVEKILLVRYESILDDPWQAYERIRGFLGLGHAPSVKAPLSDLVRNNRRKSPVPDICFPLAPVFESAMDALGYDVR